MEVLDEGNDMDKLRIFHLDMDAFYASVEEQDNPDLIGKPVIVGGKSRHGIVTTANYEARKYGIHSAMPIFMAKRACPHGHYVPNRKERYSEASNEVFQVLYDVTDLVEQVSIDEAYMDISGLEGDPLDIARYIKKKVKDKTGLTMSIGISYNKFLAKLASDWEKPDGITIIDRSMIPEILMPLPVEKIHGIGPKSAKRLNNIGIFKVEDLYKLSEEFLIEYFGKQGEEIYSRIRGIDKREINTQRERKSLGTERTFKEATDDMEILYKYLEEFSCEISQGLINKKIYGRTVTVKVKYDDFKVKTRSTTLMNQINNQEKLYKIGRQLLDEIKIHKKVRLIGLTVSNLSELGIKQLSLLD